MCWKLHAYIVNLRPKCHQMGLVCHLILFVQLAGTWESENTSPLGCHHCLSHVLSSAVISGGGGS